MWLGNLISLAILCAFSGLLKGDSIDQQPDDIGTENEMKTLTCTYSTASANPCLYWYKQYPYSALEYILRQSSSSTACSSQVSNNDQRFSSNATSSTAVLTIMSLALTDTAVYYCVLGDSPVGGNVVFAKGTELNVRPNNEGSKGPSVYLLKSAEHERLCSMCPQSVCLAIDFPTPDNDTKAVVNKNVVDLTDRFMLDMSVDNIWRYSTVLWDINHEEKDLDCKIIYKSKDITSKDTKIDEKLNTLFFTIFGLRFLTIKGIIFSLISTCRIWLS